MPGLLHDRPLRRARDRRGRGVSRTQGMAGVLGRIEVRARCQFLGHARHIDAAQAARLDLPVAIDGAEKGTGQLLPSTLEWCGSFALVCPSRPVLPDLLIFHWGQWGHWGKARFYWSKCGPTRKRAVGSLGPEGWGLESIPSASPLHPRCVANPLGLATPNHAPRTRAIAPPVSVSQEEGFATPTRRTVLTLAERAAAI